MLLFLTLEINLGNFNQYSSNLKYVHLKFSKVTFNFLLHLMFKNFVNHEILTFFYSNFVNS